jgi:hypothetical protein
MEFNLNIDYDILCNQINLLTEINEKTSIEGPLNLLEEIQKQMKELPSDFWNTIEKYYPKYSSAQEILENDIMQKFCDGEELSNKDLEWLAGIGGVTDIKIALTKSDTSLYHKALKYKNK